MKNKEKANLFTKINHPALTGWICGVFFAVLAVAGLTVFNYYQTESPKPALVADYAGNNWQNPELLSQSARFEHKYLSGVGGGDPCFTADGQSLKDCGDYQSGEPVSEPTESIYVVKEGDTLSEIAEMFGVSSNTIVWANDLGEHIHEGQHLVILPFSGVRHQVKEGDSLSKIADQYEADPDEIGRYNNITDGQLVAGEFVDVKGGIKPEPEPEKTAPARPAERIASAPPSSPGRVESGYFIRPISGGIRTQGLHGPGNTAVDLAAPYGTPIYAAAAGRVITSRTGWNSGYGNYIEIAHDNGTRTLYSHNSQNIVSEGQYVQQGQVIAYMGSTGHSTGPHVHFEIHGAPNPF